jgi:hypothetical protein
MTMYLESAIVCMLLDDDAFYAPDLHILKYTRCLLVQYFCNHAL